MKNRFNWISLALVLLAICGSAAPARAASAPTVMVEPVEVTTTVGVEIKIQILVIDGVDINAYDLTLTYDPNILRLDSWEHGDYLSNHWVVQNTDEAGIFQIADAQLGQPPVSGDGTLLQLTFMTLDEGESALTLEGTTLADSGGNESTPVTEDGSVIVSGSAGPYPIPTENSASGTQAPTAKPTATHAPTADDQAGAGVPPQDAYPLEETETMSSPTDEGGYPSGAAAETEVTEAPDDASGGESVEETDTVEEAPTGDEPSGKESETTGEPLQGLKILLWLVLAVTLLALVVIVITVIRRRRNKPEDLLI